MNICAITMYTQEIKELAVITVEYNKRKYCDKHGYDLDIRTEPEKFHTKRDYGIPHFGYEKIAAIIEVLKTDKYDWVFWCGSDTMITNYTIKLEDIIDEDYHFIVPNDLWGLNTDCLLVRNSKEALEFLEDVYGTFRKYVGPDGINIDTGERLPDGGARAWAEQGAINDLRDKYQAIIKEVPQKTMNSYLYHMYPSPWHQRGLDCNGEPGSWTEGDFIIHMPGMPNNTRISLALNFIREVIGDN